MERPVEQYAPENLLEALKASAAQEEGKKRLLMQAIQRQKELAVSRPIASLIDIVSGGQTKLAETLPTEAEAAKAVSTAETAGNDPFKQLLALEKLKLQQENQKLKEEKAKGKEGASEFEKLKEWTQTKRANDIQSAFDKETKNADISKVYSSYAAVNSALNSGLQARVSSILSQLVRLHGDVGNIASREREFVVPASLEQTIAKLKIWLKGNSDKQPAPQDIINLVRGDMSDLKKNSLKFINSRINKAKNTQLLKPTNQYKELKTQIKDTAQIEKDSVNLLFEDSVPQQEETQSDRVSKLRGLLNAK
jgi:hypothetical protein